MLHLVYYVVRTATDAERCFGRMADGDAVLFLQNGVYSLLKASRVARQIEGRSDSIRLYMLLPDLAARGIGEDEVIAGIDGVDYSGFVDLSVRYFPVQSWFR